MQFPENISSITNVQTIGIARTSYEMHRNHSHRATHLFRSSKRFSLYGMWQILTQPSRFQITKCIFFYFIRYLQMRSPRIRSRLLLPTLQCSFLLYACLCSLSRITDHRHHWWDVLAGAKLGVLFAAITVSLMNFFVTVTIFSMYLFL